MNIKLCHRPCLPSITDKSFSNVSGKLSINNSYGDHIIKEYTPIDNQLNLGSCAANATTASLEILMGIQNPDSVVQLSRLFTYWNARLFIKETDRDEGCYIRDCFTSLETLGCCPEDIWKYNTNKVFAQPNIFAYTSGNDNKIKDFYRIEDNNKRRLDLIEEAIKSNHPVVFGTDVSSYFTSYGYNNEYPVFDYPTSIAGRHAMIIVGIIYNNGKRNFVIRNSWGSNWAYDGRCLFTEDYINNAGTNDFWVPTLVPNLV